MAAIFSILRLNHHNTKQQKRKELYELLNLILKYSETIPHCSYLISYIKSALECFIFTKPMLSNQIVVSIVNKNKLKNLITFVSKRECYGIEYTNKLVELYYQI